MKPYTTTSRDVNFFIIKKAFYIMENINEDNADDTDALYALVHLSTKVLQ